jgi:OPT family oligopeptide transporter
MAIEQLSEEEVRTWTLEQKDRWWREKVYKGDMPQLTLRSGLTGMFLGGLLSLTNLYVGAKTGWTLGVGITSVILAFAAFKLLSTFGVREFHLLENNAMQSIATSAGYMTAPLVSSLAAYMMVTESTIPMFTTMVWIIALGVLGVLFAFPLKRRFINDEQHPFPEGRAAGIVMDALHTGDAKDGLLKAKILAVTGLGGAVLKTLQSEPITTKLWISFAHIPEYLDEWVYRFVSLKIGGIELRELTVRPDTDFVMVAAGGLMGIRTGASIMIGALINYLVVAPMVIGLGDIHGTTEGGVTHFGFRAIMKWGLWCGVAMMTTSSLFAFLSKPKVILSAFDGLFSKKRKEKGEDVLKDIELPMSVFAIGIPIVGGLVVALAWAFFDVEIWLGAIGIPLIFVFTLIAVNSTALTSITPSGALGKLTQLTYAGLAPGNITTNMMTAGITAEVAGSASNLLMDIKPGYMLGGKPRHQAIGHVLGIFAGAIAAVPVFYLVFLRNGPTQLVTEQYPMPGATAWEAIARVLTAGIDTLPVSARWGALAGAVVGLTLEALRLATKNKFWVSGVAVGLAFVIPFNTCLAMFLGGLLFWIAEQIFGKREGSFGQRVIVSNMEPICAGVIAGGALTGIIVVIIENFVLG